MQDPWRLSLREIGALTDDQIIGLFSKRDGLRKSEQGKRQALENLERYNRQSFRESFVEDVTRGDESKRAEALELFRKSFPDYQEPPANGQR